MPEPAALEIAILLETFLRPRSIKRVFIAEGRTPPPQLAYLVAFPRLSLILGGDDDMELEQDGNACIVKVRRGDAIFAPGNSWNKPAWARRVKVLSFLFGKHQTGVSFVSQERRGEPTSALKTHFHRPMGGPAPAILDALTTLSAIPQRSPTDRLLVEAILHSYLKMLREPTGHSGGKGDKTFQNICLHLQENSQFQLTRYSVAEHFRLSPNHVSRLFRSEGLMTFVDYLTLVRLDKAKYLLRHHDRTLAEVASSCGFSDVGYFCRVFKQKLRQTPTDYRLQKATLTDKDEPAGGHGDSSQATHQEVVRR